MPSDRPEGSRDRARAAQAWTQGVTASTPATIPAKPTPVTMSWLRRSEFRNIWWSFRSHPRRPGRSADSPVPGVASARPVVAPASMTANASSAPGLASWSRASGA